LLLAVAWALVLIMTPSAQTQNLGAAARMARQPEVNSIHPSALARLIDELAGRTVRVPHARVVGVFNPRAFLIDSSTMIPETIGMRERIVVLVDRGAALRVSSETIVGSTVVVTGVARTLLGMQVSAEVPWPAMLTRPKIEDLEIHAAILASEVKTPEGVDLTARGS
jgi:hypothetical protein